MTDPVTIARRRLETLQMPVPRDEVIDEIIRTVEPKVRSAYEDGYHAALTTEHSYEEGYNHALEDVAKLSEAVA